MKNLKISQKLLVGFGTVLLMLLLASVVSFLNMNTMEVQITNYSDFTVPNNNAVWQMRRDLISVQRYMLMALTEDDDKLIGEYLDVAAEDAASVNKTLEAYLLTTRADKSKVEAVQADISTMAPLRTEIETLLKKNDAAANAKAFTIFVDQYKPILDDAANILTEVGEFQNTRAEQQAVDARNAFVRAIIMLIAVIVVAVIITVIITIFITRAVLIPVKQVQAASLAVSQGNLDAEVTYDGKDELGDLANNMRDTMFTLKTIIDDVDTLLNLMGEGDFTCKTSCEEHYVGQYKNILTAMRSIKRNLTDSLLQINESSEQVSSGSGQVSSGAQALSQGATEQASAVEELSATIAEISEQIKQNADNAQTAKQQSERAGTEVEDSNRRMTEMISAMNDISMKSGEISKIIKTIEDIAFQTNILALNAAVEAARAGAAGKGFAVVADEVRNLAGKSAEAAKSTTKLIEETVTAVDNGTQIAGDTAQAMLGVVDVTREVTGLVNQIADASNTQAGSIAQITVGVDQISSVVQTNSATAEESAAASEELSGQAQMLKDLVGRFKLNKKQNMTFM